jgi:hypothetical protein
VASLKSSTKISGTTIIPFEGWFAFFDDWQSYNFQTNQWELLGPNPFVLQTKFYCVAQVDHFTVNSKFSFLAFTLNFKRIEI